MVLPAGTRLGPYEIVAPLGSGGMGDVYRALDPRLRREVAIKVLPAGVTNDPARLARFEQEALATASLNHPNILIVFDTGVHDGTPYVVAELIEGATLRQAMEGGSLPVRKALDYAVQCARGLAAAHLKGIVHRDLKPENLLVTRDGRVKILDFGLAKLLQDEPASTDRSSAPTLAVTEPGLILGTPGYMSPEQVRGEPADARSDIFSLALVIYEMVSGRRAFTGSTTVETLNAILTADPAALAPGANVPPALDRIVRRCLEKDPNDRYQSARDLAFGLDSISSDSQAAPGAASAPPRPVRRRWVRAVAGALLVAAGMAAGAVIARLGRSAPVTFTRLTFRRGTIDAARFAPDGQTIVYSAAWQGGPLELYSTRAGSAEARSLGASGTSILSISSTGEMALRLPNGTLARAPLAGGAPREIIEHVRAARWAPDGQTLAIVRSSGGRQSVEMPPGTVLYDTAGDITDIAVAPNGKSIACVESPPGIGPLSSIGLVDLGRTHTILSGGWRSIHGLAWSPRGDEVWFAAAKQRFGAGSLLAVTPGGNVRDIVRVPSDLELHDVFSDGRLLVARADHRVEARGLAPGETRERDLSWLDFTGLSDLSPDGRTILITEDGEVGLKIYLRPTDGSDGVHLGDGGSFGRSPDGRSMLVISMDPLQFSIQPVGPGEPRVIPHPGFDGYLWGNWFPDGRHILFAGSETGHGLRLYVEDLDGSGRHPIAPEGTTIATGSRAISPDAKAVAAIDPLGRIVLVPIAGGPARPLPGVTPGDLPIQWSVDGRALFVYRQQELPAHVYRVDVATGRKELWKDVGPSDPAGVTGLGHVLLTPDGASYAYNYNRTLSDLFLVSGLK